MQALTRKERKRLKWQAKREKKWQGYSGPVVRDAAGKIMHFRTQESFEKWDAYQVTKTYTFLKEPQVQSLDVQLDLRLARDA